MKKFLVFFLFSTFILTSSAQKIDNNKRKTVIKQVCQVYLAWNSSNCTYLHPEKYIFEEDKVVGQNFLFPSKSHKNKKYYIINLKQDTVTGELYASLNDNYFFYLSYENSKLAGISSEALYNFDFQVKTDENDNVIKLVSNKKNNNGIRVNILHYKNNRPIKIEHCFDQNGNLWLHSVKEITYENENVYINRIQYTLGKPNTPGNIYREYDCFLKKTGDNSFLVMQGWGDLEEYIFNTDDKLIQKTITKRSNVKKEKYFYQNGELYKVETVKEKDNQFIENEIKIIKSNMDQGKDIPDYEKTVGQYYFNKSGELIREEINGRYREKKNGVWSGWKHFVF